MNRVFQTKYLTRINLRHQKIRDDVYRSSSRSKMTSIRRMRGRMIQFWNRNISLAFLSRFFLSTIIRFMTTNRISKFASTNKIPSMLLCSHSVSFNVQFGLKGFQYSNHFLVGAIRS